MKKLLLFPGIMNPFIFEEGYICEFPCWICSILQSCNASVNGNADAASK